MPPKVSLVIPAAGEGSRMKSAVRKPFIELAGRPIIEWTLERFAPIESIVQVVLAVGAEDYAGRDRLLSRLSPLGVTDVVPGGSTRTGSVANALAAVRADVDIVLIHDSVRPFVSQGVIRGVIDATARHGAAIAAVAVKDTVKRVESGLILATVPREGLYLAQTPQGFLAALIRDLYAKIDSLGVFTDDAALAEAAGIPVAVVESTHANFKITTPEDLHIAQALASGARQR